MQKNWIWSLAKGLEGIGMVIVLVGLCWSMSLGMQDDGLESMAMEGYGLAIGGGMFLLGWLLEKFAVGR